MAWTRKNNIYLINIYCIKTIVFGQLVKFWAHLWPVSNNLQIIFTYFICFVYYGTSGFGGDSDRYRNNRINDNEVVPWTHFIYMSGMRALYWREISVRLYASYPQYLSAFYTFEHLGSVQSGVPQGTVLGPLLFLLHINDLPSVVNSTIRLFANDCLIYRPIRSREDQDILQGDLDSLERWSDIWAWNWIPVNAILCP